MAQPVQHPNGWILAVFDRDGQPIDRSAQPPLARRYAADRAIDAAADRQRDLADLLLTARQAQAR